LYFLSVFILGANAHMHTFLVVMYNLVFIFGMCACVHVYVLKSLLFLRLISLPLLPDRPQDFERLRLLAKGLFHESAQLAMEKFAKISFNFLAAVVYNVVIVP